MSGELNTNTTLQQQHQEECYFTSLLMWLDQLTMPKDVQYRIISIVRKLAHHYPNFMTHEKKDLLLRISIKMILNQQDYEVLELTADEQQMIDEYEVAMLNVIVSMLVQGGVGMGETPYGMIEQLKAQYGIKQKHVNAIKYLLDYAMLMNETFAVNSLDVLTACIMIHESFQHIDDQWASEILSIQTNSSILLKQVIQTNLTEDWALLI